MEFLQVYNPGVLEIYAGGMKCGKTEKALDRLRKVALFPELNYLLFKPSIDDRFDASKVVSRSGSVLDSIVIPADHPEMVLDFIKSENKVIGFSEVQFFSKPIEYVIPYLIDQGKNVICEGLNKDFRGEPFGSVPYLIGIADHAEILNAVCDCMVERDGKMMRCTNPATRTQRITENRKPAHYNSKIVLVGDKEFYEARCIEHHVVPGKPKINYKELIDKEVKKLTL